MGLGIWLLVATALLATGAYAGYVGLAWSRYGHARPPSDASERDTLLDRVMPDYDVVERHHIRVAAPAATTLAAAATLDLFNQPVARRLFRAREAILGAPRGTPVHWRGLLADVQAIGWRVLAEEPGREVVVGAVTKPWAAQVTFRSVAPEAFASFDEPGYVKIAWTLRADPISATESTFRTETRVTTTDPIARATFRRYWSFFSPGIILIRWFALRPVKVEAERRAAERRVEG